MRVYLQVVKSLGIQFSVFDVLAQIFLYLNSVHVMPVPLYTSAFWITYCNIFPTVLSDNQEGSNLIYLQI